MKKDEIKKLVTDKVNEYLKDKQITIPGDHPVEEYPTGIVYNIEVLRTALEQCFTETYKLAKKKFKRIQ